LAKTGQFGRHHHGGHVFDVDLAGAGGGFKISQRAFHSNTQAIKQGFHALGREVHVHAVAGALQTHHQAITDQLVAAHGGDRGQVFDAIGHGAAAGQQQADHQVTKGFHDVHVCLGSEGPEFEQCAGAPACLGGVGHVTCASVDDLRIGQTPRLDGVVGGDVIGADDATDLDDFGPLRQSELFLTPHHQVAICHDIDHRYHLRI